MNIGVMRWFSGNASQDKNGQLQNGNVDTLNLKRNFIKYLGYMVLIYKYMSILW